MPTLEIAAVVLGCIIGGPCHEQAGTLDNPRQCGLIVRGKVYAEDGQLHRAYTQYRCTKSARDGGK